VCRCHTAPGSPPHHRIHLCQAGSSGPEEGGAQTHTQTQQQQQQQQQEVSSSSSRRSAARHPPGVSHNTMSSSCPVATMSCPQSCSHTSLQNLPTQPTMPVRSLSMGWCAASQLNRPGWCADTSCCTTTFRAKPNRRPRPPPPQALVVLTCSSFMLFCTGVPLSISSQRTDSSCRASLVALFEFFSL